MAYAFSNPSEPSRLRRSVGLSWVAIWLVFLGSPLEHVWHHNTGVARWVGVLAVLAFAVVYLALFVTARMCWRADNRGNQPFRRRIFALFGTLVLLVLV